MYACGFRIYFTPLPGFFSPFLHSTCSLSVSELYLALSLYLRGRLTLRRLTLLRNPWAYGVFLSGLEEGLFPHENSRSEANGLEEERRLMYVATTRARRRLYLSFSQSRMLHGQTHYNVPSRFIQEIPEHLLKWIQPKYQRTSSIEPDRGWGLAASKSSEGSSSTFTPSASSKQTPWQIGRSVSHGTFGTGVIINCEGQGKDLRVQVRFNRAGTKWLLLEYANLTPI